MTHTTSDKRKRSASIQLLALLSLALFQYGCSKDPVITHSPAPRPVKVFELSHENSQQKIELPGQIKAFSQANMGFEVPGRMIELLVEEGQTVATGDLLARLDSRDYEANRDSAAAQLENAQLEAERARSLYEQKAASKQRLDIAVSNLKVAQAATDRASKAYEDTFLRSPINGVVAKILVDDYLSVGTKQDIVIIQDLSKLKVSVDVPETLGIQSLKEYTIEERTQLLKPMVYLTAKPEQGYPAYISEISSVADRATRTYEATLVFAPPPHLNVLPGMTAKVISREPTAIQALPSPYRVPSHAIGTDDKGNSFIWQISPDTMKVSKLFVELGSIEGSTIEVKSDALEVGLWIATSGIDELDEGTTVRRFKL